MTLQDKDRVKARILAERGSSSKQGVWKVTGEDPNCDLGGHHHSPTLGFFEGTLGDVIDYAMELPGFWQWGYGGDIEPYNKPLIKKIDSKSIKARAKVLRDELNQTEGQL